MPLLTTQKWGHVGALIAAALLFLAVSASGQANPAFWKLEWPRTDFSKSNVPLDEIFSGGVPKDGIPPIYEPRFAPIAEVDRLYQGTESVITVAINGEARAYPLGILMTHEIVNDELGGMSIAATYCPLCNSAVVFDRNVNGRIHTFGVSGKLRHSDLVIWDHETESWWQQFTGEAIVGAQAGAMLRALPARLESLTRFRARAPRGWVMIPADVMQQPYGETPYFGTDALWETQSPNLVHERYPSDLPDTVSPLTRVVVVGDRAWSLDHLRTFGRVETDGLILTWQPGQNSIHDSAWIPAGRDVGNIVVQKIAADGTLRDVVYDVTFVFAFRNFRPDGEITF